jgi:hypothetical protein
METEVWVTCYSEKTDISISCGIYIDSADGSIDISDTGIIYEGLSESFWENYREFEESVEQADSKQESDPTLSFEQAILSVFGHFFISCTIDGKEIDLGIDPNADDFMYSLLKDTL